MVVFFVSWTLAIFSGEPKTVLCIGIVNHEAFDGVHYAIIIVDALAGFLSQFLGILTINKYHQYCNKTTNKKKINGLLRRTVRSFRKMYNWDQLNSPQCSTANNHRIVFRVIRNGRLDIHAYISYNVVFLHQTCRKSRKKQRDYRVSRYLRWIELVNSVHTSLETQTSCPVCENP